MSDKLRFAIAGAGNIAHVHARAISQIPEAELVAVSSRREERAKALAKPYGVHWTTDSLSLVRRGDVDVVNICVPSGAHLEVAVAAAGAGKHVMVEKPLEISLSRADSIIQACEKSAVLLAVILPQRMRIGVQKVKQAIESGRLGRLTLCDAYVKWHRTKEYYEKGAWRGTWSLDGGGAIMNQSIHTIDLLQYLAGPVLSVYGSTKTLVHNIETEDTAVAVLEFKSGAFGVLEGATSTWPGLPARLEFSGERGTIILEEGRITSWKLNGARPDEERQMINLEMIEGSGGSDPMGISHLGIQRLIEDMVQAIRNRRPPIVGGSEGRKAIEIISALYCSAKTNAKVTLPFTRNDVSVS